MSYFQAESVFLLGEDLDRIISYAASKNLSIRVVTNCYWAHSFKTTYRRLCELKHIGLKEVNVSTGDEHQEWVKYDNVVNVIIASILLKLTIVVNIENSPCASFSIETMLNDYRLKKYFDKKIKNFYILQGEWMYIKKQNNRIDRPFEQNKYLRCESLFKDIIIFPTKKQYACCGLTNKYNPYMYLGDLNCHSFKELYERQFEDFVKIWLYTEGPAKILEFIENKSGKPLSSKNKHICQICAEIFQSKDNMECLKANYKEIATSVLMKFFMTKSLTTKS